MHTCINYHNLPPPVFKARHLLLTKWLCLLLGLGLPEQAMGWLPLRFGIGSKDKPAKFACTLILWLVMDIFFPSDAHYYEYHGSWWRVERS